MKRFCGHVALSLALMLVVPTLSWAAGVHYFNCKECHKTGVSLTNLATQNLCLQCHVTGGPWSDSTPAPGPGYDGLIGNSVFSVQDASNAFGGNPGATGQTSHIWAASSNRSAAGAQEPTTAMAGFYGRYMVSNGKVTCTRCHNPHGVADIGDGDPMVNPKLLIRDAMNGDLPMAPEQNCRACHVPFDQQNNKGLSTHPVVTNYDALLATAPYQPGGAKEGWLQASIGNGGGQGTVQGINVEIRTGSPATYVNGVGCVSCHAPHFADSSSATSDGPGVALAAGDGKLLRSDGATSTGGTSAQTAQLRSNLCQSCHTFKTHGNSGSQMGCLDCHSGHTAGSANYFVLRSQVGATTGLNYASLTSLHGGATPVAQVWSGTSVGDQAGYCERCHGQLTAMPGSARSHIEGENCRTCHAHDGATYSFEAAGGCDGCHGAPPTQNVSGGNPNAGYAAGYPSSGVFKDESATPHAAHAAGSGNYTFNCSVCHLNNTHDMGTFQDVFVGGSYDSLASGSGNLTPTYNGSGSGTCSTVYCHSNGGRRTGDASRVFTAATINAWTAGSTTGAITTCDACHDNSASMTNGSPAHVAHLALTGVTCKTCHVNTADSATALAAGAIGNTHVNNVRDVAFDTSGFITVGATPYNGTTGVCAVYCHGNGSSYVSADWDVATSGDCGACHQYSNAGVATGSGPALSGAHAKHVYTSGGGVQLACTVCHTNAGSGADHVNGAPSFVANYQENVCNPCHGSSNGVSSGDDRQPVWTNTASVDCQTCHAGSVVSTISAKVAADKSQATVSGHNRPTASGNYTSGNQAANKQCASCHDAANRTGHLDGTTGNATRLLAAAANCTTTCHGVGGSAFHNGIVTHQGKSCSACHEPHGGSNLFMVRSTSAGEYSGTVVFTAFSGADSYDEVDAVNTDDLCATCHTYNAGLTTAHNNKTHEGADHNEGTNCFSCHKGHTEPGGAFIAGAGNACNDCHGFPPATAAHAKHAQSAINTTSEDRSDCEACHTGAASYTYAPSTDQGNSLNHGNTAGRRSILSGTVGFTKGAGNVWTCSTACHNSGTTDGYWYTWDDVGQPALPVSSRTPIDANGLNCNACHYYNAAPTSAGNVISGNSEALSGDHSVHFGTGGVVTCADCHDVPSDSTHISVPTGTDAQKYQDRALAEQDEAEVTAGALNTGNDPDPGNATCNNVACHNPSNTTYSAQWNVTVGSCTTCHSTTNPGSGSHGQHMNAAATFGINTIACTTCHGAAPGNNAHRNATVNLVGGLSYTGGAEDVGGLLGTCTTSTCHNNGTVAATPVESPSWGTGSSDCTICHGNAPGTGEHAKHFANTTYVDGGCADCHTAATATTHINNIRNMGGQITDMDLGTGGNQLTAPGGWNNTCTNNCHTANTVGDWSDSNVLACTDCHGSGKVTTPALDRGWPPAQGAHAAHLGNTAYVTGANCTDCHNDNSATHSTLNNAVTTALGAKVSVNGGNGSCTNTCHAAAQASDWTGGSAAITCVDCHAGSYVGGGANAPASGLHAVTPSVTGQRHNETVSGGCATCHPNVMAQGTHIAGTFTGNGSVAGDRTAMGLAAFYTTGGSDNLGTCSTTSCHSGRDDWSHQWMASANYTSVTASCQGCHGSNVGVANLGTSGVTHRAVTVKHNAVAANYTCRDCHNIEGAGYTFTFGTTDWGGGSSHGDGQIQINDNTSPAVSYNTTTGYCEGCHTSGAYNFSDTGWTIAKVAGSAISTNCGECHANGVKPGSASGAHTAHNAGTSALVAGGAACTACHGNNGGLGYQLTLAGTHGSGSVDFGVSYSTAVRNDLTGTCSNASCHYSQTTPAWNTTFPAAPTKCTKCHNGGTDTGTVAGAWPSKNKNGTARSDAHSQHVTNTAYVNDVDCTDCHGDNNPTHSNAFDGTVVTAGTNMSGYAGGTCSTNTCHSSGNFTTPATLSCTNCHVAGKIGDNAGAYMPVSGLHNVTPSVTGVTHDDSFGTGGSCASCHTTVMAQGTHVNGAFTGGNGQTVQMGLAGFYTQTADNTGSCATTTCHTGRDDWAHQWMATASYTNATLSCQGCHGSNVALSGLGNAGVTHRTVTVKHNSVATNYTCRDCHAIEGAGYTFTFGTQDWAGGSNHGNGQVDINSTGTTFNQTTGYCEACHNLDGRNFADTGWTINPVAGTAISTNCGECHANGVKPGSASGAHTAHGADPAALQAGGTACVPCHGNNGGNNYQNTLTGTHGSGTVNFASVTYSQAASRGNLTGTCTTTACHNNGTDQSGAWNGAALACNDCHYYEATALSANNTGTFAIGGSHNAHFDTTAVSTCTQCHPDNSADTVYPRTHITGATVTAKANPVADNAALTPLGAAFNDTSNTCNNTACHDPSNDSYVSNAWGTPNTGCIMCHGDDQAGTKMATGSHTNHIDANVNGFGVSVTCDSCHPATADPAHMNSVKTVQVAKNSVVTPIASPTALNGCGTNDCHNNGASLTAGTPANYTWGTPITDCTECHGTATTLSSNAHNEHLNNGYASAACTDCHTAASNTNHINKNINMDAAKATYSRTASVAIGGTPSGTCSTASCHNRGAAGQPAQSAAWNTTGDLTCNSCHGDAAAGLSTSHGDHISAGKSCAQCHDTAPTTTVHISNKSTLIDGAVAATGEASITFVNAAAVTDYTYNSSEHSCYTPTNNGLGCHATAGLAGAADPTRPDWDVAFAATACTNCHTNTSTAAVNPTSGLHGVVPSVTGVQHDDSFGTGGTCSSCHTSVPQFGTHKNGAFTGNGSVAGDRTNMGLAAFYTNGGSDNLGTCATTSCHTGRDDWSHQWTATANYTNVTASCQGCHGSNLASTGLGNAGVTHRTVTVKHNSVATNYTCRDCHAIEGAGYTFTFATQDWAGGSNHGNGSIDINSTGTSYNQTSGYCESCHTSGAYNFTDTGWTINPVAGTAISTTCGECHAAGVKPGSASGAHTAHGASDAQLLDGGTACVPCHGNNGGNNYQNTLTGTHGSGTVTFASVTYSQAASRGDLTGTCLTTACHNNDTDQSGAWNSAALACNDCHYYEATVNSANNTGSFAIGGSHNAHFAAAAVTACTQCHPDNSADTVYPRTHLTGATVTAKANPVADNADLTPLGAAFNDGANTCNNAACHNPSGESYVSNAWGTANTGCTMCHGDMTSKPATGSHTVHLNASVNGFGITPNCDSCHPATADPAHMNSVKNVEVDKNSVSTPVASPTAAGGCGTNDCHNNGVSLTTGTPLASTYTWGNTITDCTECHGTATTLSSNAHNEHLNGGYASAVCTDCHTAANNANHINKNINMDAAKATYSRTASVAIGGTPSGTCSTASCHNRGAAGQPAQSAAWNTAGDLTCNSCHGDAAAGLSTSHGDHISAGKSCAQCHDTAPTTTAHISNKSTLIDGSVAATGEASITFVNAAAVTDYTYNSSEHSCYTPTNNGLGCHATAGLAGAADPTRPDWDVAFAATACTNCHTNTSTAAVNPTSGLHGVVPSVTGVQHDDSFGTGGTCSSCHTSVPQFGTHKNGAFTGNGSVAGDRTNMGLAAFYTNAGSDNTGSCGTTSCHLSNSDAWAHQWNSTANYYTTSPSACNGCHGLGLASANLGTTGVSHLAVAAQHNTGTSYQCKDCHNLEAASGYTFTFSSQDWNPLDTLSTHGDGQIQVNSSGTSYNQTTGYCEGCHTSGAYNFADTGWTIALAAGDAISANCGSCHGYPPTGGDGKNTFAAGEGKGAHAKHVAHLGAINANTDSFVGNTVCGVCHDVSTAANHSTGGGTRNLLLQSSHQFGASAPVFNGTVGVSSSVDPKTCSNLDCHFKETPVWSPVGGE